MRLLKFLLRLPVGLPILIAQIIATLFHHFGEVISDWCEDAWQSILIRTELNFYRELKALRRENTEQKEEIALVRPMLKQSAERLRWLTERQYVTVNTFPDRVDGWTVCDSYRMPVRVWPNSDTNDFYYATPGEAIDAAIKAEASK